MTAPALRDYQTEAVAEVMAHLSRGARRVLLICPTGGGKTVQMTEVMRRCAAAGARVLFLVHRRELIRQTQATLQRYGLPCGVILAGARPSPFEAIQIASVQTLARRRIPRADLVVIDEAHHFTATNTYGRIVAELPDAPVVGCTATPWRLDGKGLGDLFDVTVMTRTPAQLRDEQHLVPVTGWCFRPLDVSGVGTSGGDYRASELAGLTLTREIVGDVVREWVARARGVRTILFACGVEHSRRFRDEFRAAGVAAEHVDGATPHAERDAILARVRSGETRVLCNVGVATEGFDLPELGCVVLARPTQSLGLYLQMVGRVLRPAPGKARALILDHAGCVAMHGEPYCAARSYDPTRSKERNAERREPGLPTCPKCGAITSDDPCPECGQPRPERSTPAAVPGVAVALEEVAAAQAQRTRHSGWFSFQRPGQACVGVYLRTESATGVHGPEQRAWFEGDGGSQFYVRVGAGLRGPLRGLSVGTLVRIVYTGSEELGEGRRVKRFRVYTQEGAK